MKYTKQLFKKKIDISQQSTMIPERQEINKVRFKIAPFSWLKIFQATNREGETRQSPSDYLS